METDPTGRDPQSPGAKVDAGKTDMSLLLDFGNALYAVAEVGTFGAKKYTRGGWITVPDGINRYTAAGLRHLMIEPQEEMDPDSGLRHAAHHAWNALARLEHMIRQDQVNKAYACWYGGDDAEDMRKAAPNDDSSSDKG